jgi:gliding motility-associated-like protein
LGSTVTLTPTGPGGTYEWYNAQNGGTLLFTGPSFTSPPLNGSTVYYVQADNGCISNRIAIAVTVLPILASPSASGAIICSGSTATLTATQPGGTYEWFDASAGGTLLFTGASFTTPALTATTTYYVQSTIGSCVSGRTPVTVTVQPPPTQPTVPAMAVCPGSVATLNVTSPSGDYAWYDASTGGTQLTTGPVYVTPVLNATTIYYVEAINSGGCASNRTPVTVTVNTIPGAPTATGPASICPGNPATLTATATGTVNWYSAATGGTLLGTGNTFTTPPLSAATTYYLDQTVNGCTSSSRGSVTVAVTPVANPQFLYPSATFCASGPNPTPMLNNPAGGTFSSSPVGLVFVSTTTGQINIAASSLGTYTVTYNGNGACPFTTNTTITVTNTPSAQFTYATPYCQDQVSAAPVFPAGASAGFFTVSPSGLTFPDPTTGKFNPSQATAGTYTITNTIPASGACPMATFSTTVTIDANVVVNAGPDQTVPAGTPVTLAGSVTNGATTGTWSGGTGSFSNPGALNATYTPGAGETSATLTLTSADPPGACGPKTDQVTITFIPTPNAPAAAGTSTCSGSVATLTATAPGGTYEWYTAFTGGTLLSTGPTFVTPALTTNTTYYVQTTTAGGTSPRTPVAVTINPVPVAPFVPPGSSACYGSATTLTATGSAGGYEWYDSQTGGNLLSTGSTYTTTVLTVNTSYYVQSVVNGCSSSRIKVDVTVNPVPGITSARLINICSGTANNYTITATVPGTTFTWSRAAVIGISNPAVTNQTSSTITETLINTTHTLVNAIYTIIPSVNGCTGAPFRFIVTVNPPPSVSSPATVSVCSGTPLAYNITFDNPNGVTFTWSRAAVPGISNAPLTAQASSAIQESLVNTTNAPVDVTYVINYQSPTTCPTPPFNLVVTVYPHATLSSPSSGVACTGVAQNYSITSDAAGASFTWSRAAVPGISNTAVTNQTTASITEALDNTTTSPVIVTYIIIPSVNGCPGEAFAYKLTVYPAVVTPEANANSPVCTGSDINLQTAVVPGATYNWTGPNNFTSAQQNPTINNATSANAGTYTLYITMNGTCNSLPATVDVAVNPQPVVTVQPVPVQCTNVASVPISGTSSTKTGAWSTNGTGTFGNPPNVLNNTYLPSAQDIASGSVVLTLTSTSPDNCAAATMPVTITFKSPIITSGPSDAVCSGTALNYAITSDVATATFTWSRAAVAGISNLPVSNQTSGTITETLINTTNSPIQVLYIITPLNAGCPGAPFTYTVTVNPIPQVPKPAANSPVCVGTDINLQAPTAAGATYSWTGPNGFTSPLQNPVISGAAAANAGNYSLTITVNGCQSPAGIVTVVVDPLPTVDVGPNQTVTICPSTTSVQLAGSKGGSATGGTWTTSGSGTFTGGGSSTTVLNGQYFPSAQDVSNGSVTLTLASTSNDNCAIATATLIIKIQLLQAVTAGPDQTICSEDNASLAGQITIPGGGIWTTSGTGKFSPSASQLNASYVPSAQDIKNGSAVLTLTANNAGTCYIPTDKLTVTFAPPPTVSAGPTRYVLKGQTITLEPTVSDPGVSYSWSPNIDISDVTVKNPVVTGNVDETYTLTVTDSRGCTATSSVKVIVSPTIVIPNAFTPNGDGVNDEWNIVGLQAYQQCTVDIYDRNGQKVFHSVGYGVPWDGTYAGKQVPYGAYYYIINPNFSGLHVLSGNVTVIR